MSLHDIDGLYVLVLLSHDASSVQGVPYVIYWNNAFSCYAACHFRHALLSVVQRYAYPTCLHRLALSWAWNFLDRLRLGLPSWIILCIYKY